MLENIIETFGLLNGKLILFSGILFTLGLLLADIVLDRNIGWLTAYPIYVYQKIEKVMNKLSNVFITFILILFLNTINLFIGFVSGFFIVLPIVLAVWTGLNVGIVIRKSIGESSLLLIFLNPVAVFELPAGWISFSIGIEMGMMFLIHKNYAELYGLFSERLAVFLWIVFPLLVIAGIIESLMIHFLQKQIKDQGK